MDGPPNTSTVSVAARVSTVTATAASSHQSTPPSSSSSAQTARPTLTQVSLQAVLTPIVQQTVQQALQAAQTPACQPVGPSSRPADPSYRPATSSPPAAQQLPQQGADSGSGGESRAPFPAFVPSVCLASAASAARAGAMLDRLASSSQSLPVGAPLSSAATAMVSAVTSPVSAISASASPIAPLGPRPVRLSFDAGPGRPPIPPKLVDQIRQGEYIELAELLPDALRDNEVPQEVMLQEQHLLIPRKAPRRQIRDIVAWVDCWTAYSRVVVSTDPGRAAELMSYQDVVLRTYRSFARTDVWLRYDRNFRRKAACSPVKLDWSVTDLEIFHQSYASSSAASTLSLASPSHASSEARGSPSGSEVCRTWNNGRCTSGFSVCRRRHECDRCSGPHQRSQCDQSKGSDRPRARSRARSRAPSRSRSPPAARDRDRR